MYIYLFIYFGYRLFLFAESSLLRVLFIENLVKLRLNEI